MSDLSAGSGAELRVAPTSPSLSTRLFDHRRRKSRWLPLRRVQRRRRLDEALKRAMDILGAGVGLTLLSPLILTVFTCLSFTPGGAFFMQTRIGRDGRRFSCLKFRTMRPTAERDLTRICSSGPAASSWQTRQKLDIDPRITPFGWYLRRWGVDELPQLINVLMGDMSLVGPRPVICPGTPGYPADTAYTESPAFAPYLCVKPGLTGLWQVSGGSATSHARRVSLDQRYVAQWSIWLDLRIILATPLALIRRRSG